MLGRCALWFPSAEQLLNSGGMWGGPCRILLQSPVLYPRLTVQCGLWWLAFELGQADSSSQKLGRAFRILSHMAWK